MVNQRVLSATEHAGTPGYCQQLVTRPAQNVLLLLTDLYEGGQRSGDGRRLRAMRESGVTVICLLALNDQGAPILVAGNTAVGA
jgi:hypothetical protein